ncbi:MAG: hypothetical protein ACRC41_14175 [Sarcina sp.]
MSNEIKAASFRLNDADIKKFREIADEKGLNQAEMFKSILNSFEMAKAKGLISDRAKEIETFQETINGLVGMFINSLSINQTSEERIRETLSLELKTKDKTIADLQEQKENLKEKFKEISLKSKELESSSKEVNFKLETALNELEQKTKAIDSQQEQINTLNSIIAEYREFKEINKELEKLNKSLEKDNIELKNSLTNTEHKNKDVLQKLENIENMRDFYKNELEILKLEIKEQLKLTKEIEQSHKNEVNSMKLEIKEQNNILKNTEENYKNEINEIKSEQKIALESIKKAFKEDLNKKEIVYNKELKKAKTMLK